MIIKDGVHVGLTFCDGLDRRRPDFVFFLATLDGESPIPSLLKILAVYLSGVSLLLPRSHSLRKFLLLFLLPLFPFFSARAITQIEEDISLYFFFRGGEAGRGG